MHCIAKSYIRATGLARAHNLAAAGAGPAPCPAGPSASRAPRPRWPGRAVHPPQRPQPARPPAEATARTAGCWPARRVVWWAAAPGWERPCQRQGCFPGWLASPAQCRSPTPLPRPAEGPVWPVGWPARPDTRHRNNACGHRNTLACLVDKRARRCLVGCVAVLRAAGSPADDRTARNRQAGSPTNFLWWGHC